MKGLTYTDQINFSTCSCVKVVYNGRENVFDLDVSPFGFLALLVRIQRWHSTDPDFRGILLVLAGDMILLRPVYSTGDARTSVRP